MLCNECGKNNASIHSVQYINGVKSEMHLCPECAAKHPELQKVGAFSIAEMFKNMFQFGEIGGLHMDSTCSTCGDSLSNFKESGLLGCPDCYDAHAEQIIPVLERTHGHVQHTGEVPKEAEVEAEMRKKIGALQAEMKKAVEAEDFEQAAKLRDEISSLKQDGEK
ncbi:MAG: UvrB/UvrC motif-containing protein [Christensenellaceae bacterium]|jgi:protein arginine kinase activator